jgi:hypothetical protein
VHGRVLVVVLEQLREQRAGALVGMPQLERPVEASLALAGEDVEQNHLGHDKRKQPRFHGAGRRGEQADRGEQGIDGVNPAVVRDRQPRWHAELEPVAYRVDREVEHELAGEGEEVDRP